MKRKRYRNQEIISQDHTNLFRDDAVTLPLEDCKRQILKNLQILERHGYVSKKDGFQVGHCVDYFNLIFLHVT